MTGALSKAKSLSLAFGYEQYQRFLEINLMVNGKIVAIIFSNMEKCLS